MEGYHRSTGYVNGVVYNDTKGFTWKGHTYWPYDDNNNYLKLIVVAYDSNGVEKKRFHFDGYRYVSAIEVDEENEKVIFTTQGDTFSVNWEDLMID